jgi:PemK-like, MazF-like toxin of type II toxin-antitoxin system
VAKLLKTLLDRLMGRTTAPKPLGTARPHPPVPRQVPTRGRGRHLEYSPNPDGDADPGEIVWTWVPYEEDASQGKDRPVLVVGRNDRTVLGLMLSSQSERDGQRNWLGLGTGDWDREARPSWIRLDRVIEVDHDGIRREGAVLDKPRFEKVAAELRKNYGWA